MIGRSVGPLFGKLNTLDHANGGFQGVLQDKVNAGQAQDDLRQSARGRFRFGGAIHIGSLSQCNKQGLKGARTEGVG